MIWIHNLYSSSSESYNTVKYEILISLLHQLLVWKEEYVLMKDFNLHHSLWSKIENFTVHQAADILLNIIASYNMFLIFLMNTITWEVKGSFSTINLIFLSAALQNWVIECTVQKDVKEESDHYFIFMIILTQSLYKILCLRKSWKSLNKSKVQKSSQTLRQSRFLQTEMSIQKYINYLINFVQTLIDSMISWVKLSQYDQA